MSIAPTAGSAQRGFGDRCLHCCRAAVEVPGSNRHCCRAAESYNPVSWVRSSSLTAVHRVTWISPTVCMMAVARSTPAWKEPDGEDTLHNVLYDTNVTLAHLRVAFRMSLAICRLSRFPDQSVVVPWQQGCKSLQIQDGG